jgi:hypothetical protein
MDYPNGIFSKTHFASTLSPFQPRKEILPSLFDVLYEKMK